MRQLGIGIVFLVSIPLLVLGGQAIVGVALRAPSWQTVQIALENRPVRPESYERALQALQRSFAWQPRRQTVSMIGLLHFNIGRQQRDLETRDAYYRLSQDAFRQSFDLSPVQPVYWSVVAEMLNEQGFRVQAAEALDWSMLTAYYLDHIRQRRAILGLALWDEVDEETRERLMHSIVPTFERSPEVVTAGAVGAGIVDDLIERFSAWPAEDEDDEDGSVLAAEFSIAAQGLTQANSDATGEGSDDMRRLFAALAILTTSNVPLLAEAMTIDQYMSISRGEDEVRTPDSVNQYLVGVLDALLVLGDFNQRGGEPLFCMPQPGPARLRRDLFSCHARLHAGADGAGDARVRYARRGPAASAWPRCSCSASCTPARPSRSRPRRPASMMLCRPSGQ